MVDGNKINHPHSNNELQKDAIINQKINSLNKNDLEKIIKLSNKKPDNKNINALIFNLKNIQSNTNQDILLNNDHLSQIIHTNNKWQTIMSLNIVQTQGMAGNLYWHRLPFIEPFTIYQQKLLSLSLAYQSYYSQYHKQFYCKVCLDNDFRETKLHHRDRFCRICNADLRCNNKYDIRYYYSDKNFIANNDFGIYSLLQWTTYYFKKINKKNKVKK